MDGDDTLIQDCKGPSNEEVHSVTLCTEYSNLVYTLQDQTIGGTLTRKQLECDNKEDGHPPHDQNESMI